MLEHNGKQYARVTEVLTNQLDFAGIDPAVLSNKCRIGTNVHQAISEFIDGEPPMLAGDEIGYFASFKHWVEYVGPVFVESEVRYYNEQKMITGRVDAVVKLHGKGPCILIDFKTSAQINEPQWNRQGHLYQYLLAGAGKAISPTFLFLKLDKRGTLPHVTKFAYSESIMKECLRLVDKFWIEQELLKQ